MKSLLSLLLLLISNPVFAYKLTLSDVNGKPVPQAVIWLKTMHQVQPQPFITDNNGQAEVGQILEKVQILIRHLSFEEFTDTLPGIQADISIVLKNKDIQLHQVVVTSEYLPKSLGQSIAPVMVFDRQAIENQAANNLEDVLSRQLNMRFTQSGVLGSSMTMNGLSGQNIKFLVDGVPVIGRLDGNIDVSQINLNNVERIEVINGPMAAAYGTDAAGGVINLITRQAVNRKADGGINLYYENIGQYNTDGFAGFNTGKSSFLISGGRNFFDGWSATDTGRAQKWKPKEQIFGSAKYRWVGKKLIAGAQLNVFDEKLSNKGEPRMSPYFAYAFDEYYFTRRITGQLNGTYVINRDYTAGSSASWSYFRRIKNTYRKDLVTLNELLVPGNEEQDTTSMNTFALRGTVSRVREKSPVSFQAGYDLNYDRADGSRFNGETKYNGDYALFFSAEYKATSKLELKPAVRFSYNSNFKAPVIPSLAVRYGFSDHFTARFSYGKGFRAPGIKEMYLYFVDINHNIRGNENLLPEYSDNLYFSLNNTIKAEAVIFDQELSAFYNSMRNLITLAQPDPDESLFTYINLGHFSTHGSSFRTSATYKNISAGAGVSYTGRYNIYSDSADFQKFIYSPDFSANVRYEHPKWKTAIVVYFKFNGKLPGYRLNDDGTITQFTNDSYRFLDATISKKMFANRLSISAGVRNILNVTNINAMTATGAHTSDSGQEAVGTGRSVFGKLTYTIGK